MNPKSSRVDLIYSVPAVRRGHCQAAIAETVSALPGVNEVEVDLSAKRVTVRGAGLEDQGVRAAIEAAGYEVER